MVQRGSFTPGTFECAVPDTCDHSHSYSITPAGLDIRIGSLVIDGSWMLTYLSNGVFENKLGRAPVSEGEKWIHGYSVGVGVGFP
ncbi:MAG: hypothetical protein ACJARS_000655 [bacterium]|jgi:hypothetical protein